MLEEQRDQNGRLRVHFFVKLIRDWLAQGNNYDAACFKQYVQELGILAKPDQDLERNGYSKWKHRTDRAAQKVLTGI
jgi:hypothetical protein